MEAVREERVTINVNCVAHHRNGVSGEPFYVVDFTDGDGQRLMGIVFDEHKHVAVLDPQLAAQAFIEFGWNSWRGDEFEAGLRAAVQAYEHAR